MPPRAQLRPHLGDEDLLHAVARRRPEARRGHRLLRAERLLADGMARCVLPSPGKLQGAAHVVVLEAVALPHLCGPCACLRAQRLPAHHGCCLVCAGPRRAQAVVRLVCVLLVHLDGLVAGGGPESDAGSRRYRRKRLGAVGCGGGLVCARPWHLPVGGLRAGERIARTPVMRYKQTNNQNDQAQVTKRKGAAEKAWFAWVWASVRGNSHLREARLGAERTNWCRFVCRLGLWPHRSQNAVDGALRVIATHDLCMVRREILLRTGGPH